MIYEYISVFLGLIKIYFYKLLYWKRITIPFLPKINASIHFLLGKGSKLIFEGNTRIRSHVTFRIAKKCRIQIGGYCFINDGCSFNCRETITIGNHFKCGPHVFFFDHDHDYKNDIEKFKTSPIVVGDNVWIGAGCIILKGVHIGDGAVIGAGTIVNKDVAPHTVICAKQEIKERSIG